MGIRSVFALCMVVFTAAASAQTPAEAPEWKEDATPPPPAYSRDKLIPIEMPPYVTLKVGIDPETVVVGADKVVRYVVVMRNTSGSVNAAYEGILCTTGEVKTYARVSSAGGWVLVTEPQWRPMTDNLPSRHAYAIAQQGACDGHTAAKREDILKALRRRQRAAD